LDAAGELDALMKFWKETCAIDPTISDGDVVNFFTEAVQSESFIIFPYQEYLKMTLYRHQTSARDV